MGEAITDQLEHHLVLHPSGGKVLVPIEKEIHKPQIHVHDSKTTCRYASKRCVEPRTTKRNGELHSFCEWHRSKANQNQRRLESKKKRQRESPLSSSAQDFDFVDRPQHAIVKRSKQCSPFSNVIKSRSSSKKRKKDRSEQDPVAVATQYSPDSFEPIEVHDQHVWAATYAPHQPHYGEYATPHHLQCHGGYYWGSTFPQNPPLSNPFQELEFAGDLIGSSVAFASTLQL